MVEVFFLVNPNDAVRQIYYLVKDIACCIKHKKQNGKCIKWRATLAMKVTNIQFLLTGTGTGINYDQEDKQRRLLKVLP